MPRGSVDTEEMFVECPVDKVGRVCGDGCGEMIQRVTATAVLSLPKLTDLSDLDSGDFEHAWLLDSIQKMPAGCSSTEAGR